MKSSRDEPVRSANQAARSSAGWSLDAGSRTTRACRIRADITERRFTWVAGRAGRRLISVSQTRFDVQYGNCVRASRTDEEPRERPAATRSLGSDLEAGSVVRLDDLTADLARGERRRVNVHISRFRADGAHELFERSLCKALVFRSDDVVRRDRAGQARGAFRAGLRVRRSVVEIGAEEHADPAVHVS